MRFRCTTHLGLAWLRPLIVLTLGAGAAPIARAEVAGSDRLTRPGAPAVPGRLRLDPTAGLGFVATPDGGAPVQATPTPPGSIVDFATEIAAGAGVPPLFQVSMGTSGRISGDLVAVADGSVTLAVPWQTAPVVVQRPGARSLVQRLGEVGVAADDFDALDPAWDVAGEPQAVVEGGESAVRLPAGGASIGRRFDEPVASGRIDLRYRDDGVVRPGRSWSLILTFRAPGGPATVRVLLGWEEESLAVESPEGPALVVQRLARADRWRRATIQFARGRTEIAVDGHELAHGRQPDGPLESIRIAAEGGDDADAFGGLVGAVQVVRFIAPPSSLEIDPGQDEARLVVGDQLFGSILRGDRRRVEMTVDDRPMRLGWEGLAGLYFRRLPAVGAPVAGALARVEWLPADEPDVEPDFADGAVVALTNESLTLATPYAGTLQIPRRRLSKLQVQEPGLRFVIDPGSHHLGDEISGDSPALDPPVPEGGVLEWVFEVPAGAVSEGPASLVLDVVGVVGEAAGLMFSDQVRRGEYKTHVVLDGERIDDLNRHIDDANLTPRRIRIPLPEAGLRPGRRLLRLEQTGDEHDPTAFDDLGILGAAVEFSTAPLRP